MVVDVILCGCVHCDRCICVIAIIDRTFCFGFILEPFVLLLNCGHPFWVSIFFWKKPIAKFVIYI